MFVDLPSSGVLASHDFQRRLLLLDEDDVLTRDRERPDDPIAGPHVHQIVSQYEASLARALRSNDVEHGRTIVRQFEEEAMLNTESEWEKNYVRCLALSADLFVLCNLDGDVREAAAVADQLVALPTHTRMAQLWQLAAFAGYCKKKDRAELAWPALLSAVRRVEIEIPDHHRWITHREYFYDIIDKLWSSIPEPERLKLEQHTTHARK